LVEADGVEAVDVIFLIVRAEPVAVTRARGAINPGWAAPLKVVPRTPVHASKESEMDCSISVSCAGVPCAATVRIVVLVSGKEVLQRRLSGEASERFQRFGCGQPPARGTWSLLYS
jgi:hypothetical protein